MTGRLPCPPAPGWLEGHAGRFDAPVRPVWRSGGGSGVPDRAAGAAERNKTLTALAGAEPVTGAGHPAVQRLQFFLSESRWHPERVNARWLEMLAGGSGDGPDGGGVLVVDDERGPKEGDKTAHVGRQWPGRDGNTDNGVVTVTTLWADERLYYPVHAVPDTPARHFAKGQHYPVFRTKLASVPSWRPAPGRRGLRSVRWPPTAPTGTRMGSAPSSPRRGCRS